MDSYSVLWGTAAAGEYRFLWVNRGLQDFLRNIGAKDPDKTVQTVQNTLRSFVKYPDYQTQPTNDLPVSMHYAPMHLYKLPDFPGQMKPFCALSVTGAEERVGGRDSTYTHTVMMSREAMYGDVDKYNHVDMLFGYELANAAAVDALRSGRQGYKFDGAPEKVSVRMKDAATAIYAASVIFENEGSMNLVFKLEDGCAFNRRAVELLKQIYSLLPPRLAAETGFATYHAVADIDDLSKKNSIQIYVLPADAGTAVLDDARNIVLELGKEGFRAPLEKKPLTLALDKWSKMTWENRSAAYQTLFADTETSYQDAEVFVQRSEAFFEACMTFEKWLVEPENAGSLHTLADIEAVFAEHPEWARIPWAKKQLKSKLPVLLAKGVSIAKLRAQTLAECKFMPGGQEQQAELQRYQDAEIYGAVNVFEIANLVAAKQGQIDLEKKTAEIMALNAQHDAQIAEKNERIDAEQKARAADKEAADRRMYEMETAHAEQVNAIHVEHTEQVNAIHAEHAEQMKQAAEVLAVEKKAHGETRTALSEVQKTVKDLESCMEEASRQMEDICKERDAANERALAAEKETEETKEKANAFILKERQKAEQVQSALREQMEAERKAADVAQEQLRQEIQLVQQDAQKKLSDMRGALQSKDAELMQSAQKCAAAERKYQELADDFDALKAGTYVAPEDVRKKPLLPWWLALIIGVVAGAILLGAIWLTTALVRNAMQPDEVPEMVVQQTPVVTATPEPTPEATPEPTPELTPEPTPEPTPEASDVYSAMDKLKEALALEYEAAPAADFLYASDGSAVEISGYVGPGGVVIVPDEIDGMPVTGIAAEAFYQNEAITGIVMPETLQYIGENAFEPAKNLSGVIVLPEAPESEMKEAVTDEMTAAEAEELGIVLSEEATE